ncbi:superkiller complex protein 3 isoform X1 [Drosophila sulfurigaster albostrigata]|uniref:superkiller complex protein 3 isoform X1 n=1 Tax=Drosophila sulfurigaster albostrigata TaxID=89887 RepID=UPI002D21BB45|nr:superkiller complex protein 3 isoform X1 [Drosophila sulfurigaster albostrigata]
MSSKETKALIKDIRETIKLAKYGDAIHKCQRLLKGDPKNYMGYLLLGAAYQNVDKSEAAKYLHKSIEYTEGPATVALQGLANCAPNTELPDIYDQLLDLIPEKTLDYYEKLFTLSSDATLWQACLNIFKKRALNHEDVNSAKIQEYLGRIWFANDVEIAAADHELYENSMETLLRIGDAELKSNVYKRYLKWLYKNQDLVACLRNACNMTVSHPRAVYGYEWICKIYCENHDQPNTEEWMKELKLPIQTYAEQLLEFNANSNLALLIKAFDLFKQEQYVAARQLTLQAQQCHPSYKVTLQLLARIHMKFGAYRLASLLWQELGRQNEEFAQCQSYEKDVSKLKEAAELLTGFPQSELNVKALARCYHKLGEAEKLKSLQLDDITRAEYLLSPNEAVKAMAGKESFEALLLCGKLHMELKDYGEALNCMLKAARLQPHIAECFDYLARLYQANGDISRARKCFEKCISLNALSQQAVDSLSSIYQQLGEEDLNETLLLNTLRYLSDDEAVRLQYKLGLHFLHVHKWDNAIQCFRLAIKYDVKCMVYWESLGDAYAGRGSYNSGIRVFQKILELSPGNCYALLQLAVIKTTIRMYPEAIADFDLLLKDHPDYLPALKGAAEAHIGLANNLKSQNIYGRAKDHFQLAVGHLQSAFLQPKAQGMIWLWRLTANVFVQTAQLPQSLANLDVAGSLAKREEEIAYLSRKDLLQLAQRFYLCALKFKQNTFLWYELALCSYYSAVYMPEEAKDHLETAAKVCKMAIKENTNRWQNWNLLGVINMHAANENLAVAQHCFIQSLNLERRSYTSWTNLGVLYLKLSDIRLANEAFKRAQQSSPIYPNAWIGQAMVAELIGDQEEAFDLFRHCQQFEYHPEAAIGYAHWVCQVISDPELREKPHNKYAIENWHADIYALDAINWYVQNEEADASVSALTFQGFLCIRQKLYQQAIKAFSRACKQSDPGADRDKLYTNLGYLYLKIGQPEQAVNAFNTVAHATFKPIIGLALAYYRSGQLEQSYSIYNSVLGSVVGQDDEKAATILVAMASMVYAFQGERDTKTVLYQCILLKGVPIQALYSACALGVLHEDNDLCEMIMSEFKAYQFNEEHCANIAYLTAYYWLINVGARQALNYLQTQVRMFPLNAGLRRVFLKFLLDYFREDSLYELATANTALMTLKLGHNSLRSSIKASEEAETRIYVSRALEPVDKTQSEKQIQCALRLNPSNTEARQLLAAITAH